MKKRGILLSLVLAVIVVLPVMFVGCGTTAGAWVALKSEGYVVYTSYKYPTSHSHIVLWESKEKAQESFATPSLEITFYPGILAPDEVNGEKTTVVDLSGRYHDMQVYVDKSSSIYDANKSIYLNGKKLTPTYTNDLDNLLSLMFENFEISKGTSDNINYIEYK